MTAHPIHRRSRQRGFTLIELLVTMTVMIVMLGIGIPAFKNFTATQRVKAVAVDVATALLLARSEAVKRNKTVTIAPLTAGDWTSGWTVKDTAMVLDQKNAISGLTITGSLSTVSYQPSGRVATAAAFDVASTVTSDARRCVKVDLTGVPRTTSGACS